jgi:hypothetical protein
MAVSYLLFLELNWLGPEKEIEKYKKIIVYQNSIFSSFDAVF